MTETPPPETCAQCGFDGSQWADMDTTNTLRHAANLIAFGIEGFDPALLNTRPDPSTWSILEYVDHLREVVFLNHAVCAIASDEAGRDLGSGSPVPMAAEPPDLDAETVLAGLATEGRSMATTLARLDATQWRQSAIVGDTAWSVAYSARHACHDLMHHLVDIATIRDKLGDIIEPMQGEVHQVNSSSGGVPKLPADVALVDAAGVVGDVQASRRHHGRPWQALCLYSVEVIAAFRDEGHPITAGAAGENVTVRGIDWARLRAGLIVEIGDVRCRLSAPATPCSKNSRWFTDRDHNRMDHGRHPGRSRWYASVLAGGAIHPGDPISVRS